MGRSSAEIQYDLERQRNALEARIDRFNRRVRDDAQTVREEAREDLERHLGKDSKAAQHPKALVGGAAGVGMLLGRASSKVSLRPRMPSRNGKQPEQQRMYGPYPDEQQASRKQRALNAVTGSAMGTATSQLDNFITDVWESFKAGFRNPEREPGRVAPGTEGGTTYLSREEISPYTSSHSRLDGDPDEAREILHDAAVEDAAPRENMPAYPGVQGEGLAFPQAPGVQPPYEEGRQSERRTGQ